MTIISAERWQELMQDAMRSHGGGGAFAEALDDGEIKLGDLASWLEA